MKNLRSLDQNRVYMPEFNDPNLDKSKNGMFEFMINKDLYFVVASECDGWQHVSISNMNLNKMPTWDVLEYIKNKFFHADEFTVEFHPKKADYINNVENCLHMWAPVDKTLPYPDMEAIKKNKPQIIEKRAAIANGNSYIYTHAETDDFEILTISSIYNRRPSWNDVCKIKQHVFGDVVALTYHAKKGDKLYKMQKENDHSIMVWKYKKENISTPPTYLVGVKGITQQDLANMTEEEILGLMQ